MLCQPHEGREPFPAFQKAPPPPGINALQDLTPNGSWWLCKASKLVFQAWLVKGDKISNSKSTTIFFWFLIRPISSDELQLRVRTTIFSVCVLSELESCRLHLFHVYITFPYSHWLGLRSNSVFFSFDGSSWKTYKTSNLFWRSTGTQVPFPSLDYGILACWQTLAPIAAIGREMRNQDQGLLNVNEFVNFFFLFQFCYMAAYHLLPIDM